MEKYRYVIVGGGMVAGYAAQELVARGLKPGELAILSADAAPPYERPPLSKGFLAGREDEASVAINPPEFYGQHGIALKLRAHVTAADPAAHTVRTSDGAECGYEKLLIATGSAVRPLPGIGQAPDGLYYLRSLDDSKRIRAAAGGAQRAVVAGAGFIAMEVSAVLADRGVKTWMVFPEDRVWQRFFTPEMSAYFRQYYEQRGVTFIPGDTIAAIEGNGAIEGVRLGSGERLRADLVVAGVGVVPAVAPFDAAGLRIDNGIVVDDHLRASAPDIYAAGDVANYPDAVFGTRRRVEHWDNAVEQGRYVARAMTGDEAPWAHVPYFFSDVFDLSYEFWGDTADAQAVYRGDVTTSSFSAWWLRDGVLRAAFVMQRPDEERERAPEWIAQHARLDPGRLADDSVPLTAALARAA
jgi:3-phenylpropionate/trans-cinnamate dioxygenase ferredoxin reductase subunit